MDAEQLRDAVLSVAGNLDSSLGGPSAELTPGLHAAHGVRQGKPLQAGRVSAAIRFSGPNISAEKRFTTTVPLQRLFLMNSDFMQVEAEELAKRVAGEPDNRSRIRKAYLLAYGREPSEEEIKLGTRLPARRAAAGVRREQEGCSRRADGAAAAGSGDGHATADASTGARRRRVQTRLAAGAGGATAAPAAGAGMPMGMGMMGGMGGRGGRGGARRASEVRAHRLGPLRQDPVQLQRICVYQLRTHHVQTQIFQSAHSPRSPAAAWATASA